MRYVISPRRYVFFFYAHAGTPAFSTMPLFYRFSSPIFAVAYTPLPFSLLERYAAFASPATPMLLDIAAVDIYRCRVAAPSLICRAAPRHADADYLLAPDVAFSLMLCCHAVTPCCADAPLFAEMPMPCHAARYAPI